MIRYCRHLGLTLLLGAIALSGAACRTLEYRSVQSDFEQAVQANNTGTPFGRQYEDVYNRLTTNYIAKLDPKLRPNAWMLRAVSAWRAGLTNAEESATAGLGESTLVHGSRDEIILKMIPALVVDSDLQRRWLAAKRHLSEANYKDTFERGFKAAIEDLNTVESVLNEKTPVDASAYRNYHHWRILINWAAVIGSIDPLTARGAAQDRATALVGQPDLKAAADVQRDKIPADHALRALIRAQGGG